MLRALLNWTSASDCFPTEKRNAPYHAWAMASLGLSSVARLNSLCALHQSQSYKYETTPSTACASPKFGSRVSARTADARARVATKRGGTHPKSASLM